MTKSLTDHGVYKVVKDPENGKEVMVPDETAKCFGPISSKDLEKCISKGIIPKEMGDAFLKQIEKGFSFHEFLESKKKSGETLTSDEILEAYKQFNNDVSKESVGSEMEVTVEFINFLIKHKDKVLSILTENEAGTFRVSRDITDSKFRQKEPQQLELFDFNELGKEQNIASDADIKLPYLDLSEAEDKVLIVLCQLLARNSERFNQSSGDYYMGNAGKGRVTIEDVDMETARMTITPHEFYKTYLGRDNYGSDNSKHLWETMISLAKKQFLVSVTFPSYGNKKSEKPKFNTFRTFSPLFKLGIINSDQTEKEHAELSDAKEVLEGRGSRLLFKFNPLFTNTIRERYIEFPENIHLRIAQTPSAGKRGKIPQCVNLMRDLLFREKQLQRYEIERDEDTLIHALGLDKELKAGRKGRIRDRLSKSFDIFKEIGLLKKVEQIKGAKGQVKYRMHINKDFK